MTSKLRVVVFSAGEWTFDRERIVRALSDDERFEIILIVVDEYRRSIWKRARFLLRVWGPSKFVASALASLAHKIVELSAHLLRRWHDSFVPPVHSERLLVEQLKIQIVRVPDINAPESIKQVIDAAPDLGIILGGRILKTDLVHAPRLGTLNIHKHDVRRYRGGAEIGYPEILNADQELGITIHWATAVVDAGPVVATSRIPVEKFDTIGSLKLKAACASIGLYVRAVQAVEAERKKIGAAAEQLGPVLFSTPLIDRMCQEREIDRRRRRFTKAEAALGLSPLRVRTMRAARTVTTFAALPYLKTRRQRLAEQGRAPIVIFYYHGISNAAENWMTLDLLSFHRQIEYLHRYFDILPLDVAVETLRGGTRQRPAVVLTFDDGYASVLNELVPYLKARELPATFFVCAAAADGSYALRHDQERGFGRVPLMDAMGWKQVADSGFEIGCHGYDHEDMATLDSAQLHHAMIDSADIIAARIGRPVRYLSFPFGNLHNISPQALSVAEKRFDAVFSAYGGYNIPGQSGPFRFTRFSNPVDNGSLTAIMNGLHRMTPYYRDLAS
jgi:peptidoglycan/xylan/chitin deacetylase (PgdA/CDA1 family)/methionyl-tRNA formyltransferase